MNVRVPTSFASALLVVCSAFAAMSMAVGCERSSDATASNAAPTAAKDVDPYDAARKASARNIEKFRENLKKLHPAAEQLKVIEPVEGTVLKHGERVRVVVELPKNFTPRNGVLIGLGRSLESLDQPPYVATLVVPETIIGDEEITILSIGTDDAVTTASVKVKVVAAEELVGLSFTESNLLIFPKIRPGKPASVEGIYASGRRGDISPDIRIAYKVDDPSIATVDDQGYVTAGNFGRTRIHATAGEFTASIELRVEDSD